MGSLRDADLDTVRLLDALVAFWVVVWLVLSGWTVYSVWVLAEVGQTTVTAGMALDSAGQALERISAVPLVGESAGSLGNEVRATAAQVTAQGLAVGGQVRRLAVLLGLSVFFIPVTTVVGLWAPPRLARRRETAHLRQALREHIDNPGLRRYLAGRAVDRLPYMKLREVTDDPYGDLLEGRWDLLADLELERLGLGSARPPSQRTPAAPPER